MPATVAPPASALGLGSASGLWSNWSPRDQWQFALHASRPLAPDELHRLIKLNAALGRAALVLARPSSWPPVRPPWYNVDISSLSAGGPRPAPSPAPSPLSPSPPPWPEGWLPAAALLFTLLLLIARATERCLTTRLRRRRAQRAEEWPTPNVLATSTQDGRCTPLQAPPYTSVPSATLPTSAINITVDLPPPYSECANTSNSSTPNANSTRLSDSARSTRRKRTRRIEEPPPPYTSVSANYTIPKYGEPSVHFYNHRRNLHLANNIAATATRMSHVMDATTNLMTYVLENHINATRLNNNTNNSTRRNDEVNPHGGFRIGRHGTDQSPAYYVDTQEDEGTVLDNSNASQPQTVNDTIGEQPTAHGYNNDLNLRQQHLNTVENSSDPANNFVNNAESVTKEKHSRTNVVAFSKDFDAQSTSVEMEPDDDVRLGDLGDDDNERFDEIVIKALDDAKAQVRNGDPDPRV